MKIAYLDGRRLRRGLLAGARLVRESAAYLDSINVFPVPDGDTGANMAATVTTLGRGVRGSTPASASGTLRVAADAAIEGARGNSGAILAQFFHGLAEELRHEARVGALAFARAVQGAARRTRAAVSNPREGTILSVLHDWALALGEQAERHADFFTVWKQSLEAARRSLERTRELLPEARKAGVVDAGASGFVRYLEGVDAFIEGGSLRALDRESGEEAPELALPFESGALERLDDAASGFRYCVEARLESGSGELDPVLLRAAAEGLGDSVVVAGGGRMARVHVHSDDPPAVFAAIERYGTAVARKVDDMAVQRGLAAAHRACVLVVDSTADLPDQLRAELLVPRVPVHLTIDGVESLDRDAIRAGDLAAMLRDEPGLATATSQPSHADYLRILAQAGAHADEVVYLGLSGTLSGTLEAGRRAGAELQAAGGAAQRAVDSRSGSIGVALIARRCALAAASGASGAQVEALALELRGRLGLRFAVRSLDRLVRSGRLSRFAGLALGGLGVRPILSIGEDGKIAKAGLFVGPGRIPAVLEREVARAARGARVEDLAVTHVGEPGAAQALAEALALRFSPERPVLVVDLSPAIAVHVGPGALGVAWIAAPARTEAALATSAAANT